MCRKGKQQDFGNAYYQMYGKETFNSDAGIVNIATCSNIELLELK
jgi:hypothetical protein